METETLEKKSKRRYWYFLIALTVAGFLMRLLGCFWGMPLLLHPDEPATVDLCHGNALQTLLDGPVL